MKSWKLSYFPIKMKRISILSSSVTLGFVDNFLVIIPFRFFLFFSSPHFYKAIHKGKKNFFPFTFAWLNLLNKHISLAGSTRYQIIS